MEKHADVLSLIESTGVDKEFVDELKEEIDSKSVGKELFSFRCRYNVSVEDLAKGIGCTPAEVEKIEHTKDKDLDIKLVFMFVR